MAYLPGTSFRQTADLFFGLQQDFELDACEVHTERIQFATAFYRPEPDEQAVLALIRRRVAVLGFHLPYLDLNPLSVEPEIAGFARERFRRAIDQAADAGADYVVFHARGRSMPDSLRAADLSGWLAVLTDLTEWAGRQGVSFCQENADDLRSLRELAELAAGVPGLKVCIDIGHLFERLALPSGPARMAARIWDHFLPWCSASGKGMPFYEAGGAAGCLNLLGDSLQCIHVHNHDGRLAHQPLTLGKIDIGRFLGQCKATGVPVILEADYRRFDQEMVRKDLDLLGGWLR